MKKLILALIVTVSVLSFTGCSTMQNVATTAPNYDKVKPTVSNLVKSIKTGNNELTKLLIEKGAKINGTYNYSFPLMEAVKSNNIEIVNLLISKNVDLTMKDYDGYPSVYYAISNSQLNMVRIFSDAGYDMNQFIGNKTYTYPVLLAIEKDTSGIFYFLLDKGVDLTVRNSEGVSALIKSISANNIDITNILLEKGLSPNEKTRNDITPLMQAAKTNGINIKIVESLLNYEAEIDYINSKRHSAFSLSCLYNNPDVALYLFEKGANTIISGDNYESNARKNHFLADYYLAKDDIQNSKENFHKANEYYQQSLKDAKAELFGVNAKIIAAEILGAVAAGVVQGVAAGLVNVAYINYGYTGAYSYMYNPIYYSNYSNLYNTAYIPSYSKSSIIMNNYQLPENSSLYFQKEFYKNKIKQFKAALALTDKVLAFFDKGYSNEELHAGINSIQLNDKDFAN